jgi:hypothetical protein
MNEPPDWFGMECPAWRSNFLVDACRPEKRQREEPKLDMSDENMQAAKKQWVEKVGAPACMRSFTSSTARVSAGS